MKKLVKKQLVSFLFLLINLPAYSNSNFSESDEFKDFIQQFSKIKNFENIYSGYDPYKQPIILVNSKDNKDEFVFINEGKISYTTSSEKQEKLDLFAYYYPKAKMGISFNLPKDLENHLIGNKIKRAFIFKFNFEPNIIKKLTEHSDKYFDSMNILRLVFIIHEGFHLHITLPRWIEKDNNILWPKWDIQPNRKNLVFECYESSSEIKNLYKEELSSLIKVFETLYLDKNPLKENIKKYANDFILKRELRYKLTNDKNLSMIKENIVNCEKAEAIMELEEGIPDFMAQIISSESKIISINQIKDFKESNIVEPFYSFGALELLILYKLDKNNFKNIIENITTSKTYEGGIYNSLKKIVKKNS